MSLEVILIPYCFYNLVLSNTATALESAALSVNIGHKTSSLLLKRLYIHPPDASRVLLAVYHILWGSLTSSGW